MHRIDESTSAQLGDILAQGRGYFWAIRHAYGDGAGDVDALRDVGIDLTTLLALKELEPGIARAPHPAAARADHRYLDVPIPPDMMVHLAPILTERGVEVGTELFPSYIDWTFAHDEIQYCTGGATPIDTVLPHGATESKLFSTGDVMAIPAGTRVMFHSSEEGERFGHAHIYLTNLTDALPRTYYDAVPFLRLQQFGHLDGEAPPLTELGADRIEIMDWSLLVEPREGGSHDLPSWLRNGWERRETTRALDYAEGAKSLVISSPDRSPEEFLPWGEDRARCFVNPIVAEAGAAVADCRLPAGYQRSQAATELWTVLRGSGSLRQTLPPLHSEQHTAELERGMAVVVPGGGRVMLDDASDDLIVRRLASSCAHNGHWAMMEAKLVADGVVSQL